MTKIVASLLVVVALVGVVASGTLALFSDNATINGITISSTSADLKVFDGSTFADNWDLDQTLSGIFPGFTQSFDLSLQNASAGDFALDITGILTSAGGDWASLKDWVFLKIMDDTQTITYVDTNLSNWNLASQTMGTIASGGTKDYKVIVYVPANADNSIAEKTLTDVTFVLTGTQVVTP